MRKWLMLVAVVTTAVLGFLDLRDRLLLVTDKPLKLRGREVRRRPMAGTWKLASLAPEPERTLSAKDTPVDIADRFLKERRASLGLQTHHELRPSVFQNPLGARVSYTVSQDGVPILGSEIRLQIGSNGEVTDLDSTYVPLKRVDIGRDQIDRATVDLILRGTYAKDPSADMEPSKVLVPIQGTDRAELAYVVNARETAGARRSVQLLLRASDGQLLGRTYSRREF